MNMFYWSQRFIVVSIIYIIYYRFNVIHYRFELVSVEVPKYNLQYYLLIFKYFYCKISK